MPFRYRAITANCGNDAIGELASQQISRLLNEDKTDFFIINCQEVDFNKTKQQLEDRINGYKVVCLSQMATHTKFDTQFHSNTGIATFIIYKEDLVIGSINAVEARREKNRVTGGSGHNKGGLVTDFTISWPNGEKIKLQTVSGHLDAANIIKRNQDWHTLYEATLKNVNTWDELVDFCPHLLISGYDANTRNKLDDEDVEENMWDSPNDYPEIHGIYHASLSGASYSGEHTYNHVLDPQDPSDPKRPGYAARGMLDFVGIADGREPTKVSDNQVIQIQPENNTERDHSVIISPSQQYAPLSPFERVRNQVASRLQVAAPQLALKIRAFKEDQKEELVEIYKNYLNPGRLVEKSISLHTDKLKSFNRLQSATLLKNNELQQKITQTLFREWLTGNADHDKRRQELMHSLLTSLKCCNHESGITARLDLYQQLENNIFKNESINFEKKYKSLAIYHYLEFYYSFVETLDNKSNKDADYQNLQKCGENILKQLDAIAHHEDLQALGKLDAQKLDTLTRIIEQCNNAYWKVAQGDEIQEVTDELTQLSREARGNSSVLWQVLGDVLDLFVQLTARISRLISKEETSDDAKSSLGIVQDKRVSDSILNYKTALKDKATPDEDIDEKKMDLK